ncbi:MAG: hypothetical protein ACPGJV_01725 [Bacteriovoracaceae bacterium]
MRIESPFLSVEIEPSDASVVNIYDKERREHYFSGGGLKHFFPIVGNVKDDRFRLGRKFYPMTSEGIIGLLTFTKASSANDSVVFEASSNEETLKVYPFEFKLSFEYKVYGPNLNITWKVENTAKKEILFSVGSKMTFDLPGEGEKLRDYYWSFEKNETYGAYYLQEGLINFEYKDDRSVYVKNNIPLHDDIFRSGPLVFREMDSEKISLINKQSSQEIEFFYGNSKYLAIGNRSKLNLLIAHGITDYIFSDHDFYKKEGIVQLDPLGTFKESFEIRFK